MMRLTLLFRNQMQVNTIIIRDYRPCVTQPKNYNKYFGIGHFKSKPWYGGHANILGKNNNDCHYDKFTVAGQKSMVIFIPYDINGAGLSGEDKDGLMLKWARAILPVIKIQSYNSKP